MKLTSLIKVFSLQFIVLSLTLSSTANAGWVRGQGLLSSGGSVDPLIENGSTISTGQFGTPESAASFYSQADLGNGTLKARTTIGTPSIPANGQALATPAFGETVTFDAPAASTWDFEFAVDMWVNSAGGFDGSASNPPFTTFDFTYAFFELYIFPGGTVGPLGSANSWGGPGGAVSNGQALFQEFKYLTSTPGTPKPELFGLEDLLLSDSISGQLALEAGINSFDIVTKMVVSASAGCCFPAYLSLDALNTATFSIDSTVPFTSGSGVFLTGTNITGSNSVPVPGSFALFVVGFISLITKMRLVRFRSRLTD
ncbi:MAG: hypothetical protein R3F41_12155 [Gammaproteobacteria bacterium]|nr:hypothetical protein [Pseudomonadales bacterium]